MSKFNSPKTPTSTKTVNLAGGEAYKETSKLELLSILLCSFVEDKFYEKSSDTLKRIKAVITTIKDKQFVAKAAIYARNQFGMRSISHAVAGEIAASVKGESWTKDFFSAVVRRPDDITEILSYYKKTYKNKPLPNSLKKGLAKAFDKFDEYQLAKYRGEGNEIKLIDAVNLVHPKPTKGKEGNSKALKKLVNGELTSTETWESKLTKAGQKAKNEDQKMDLKADAWSELIKEKKIGYFALLRNLRNILEQAPDSVTAALKLLTDEKLIKKSLVLPFRFSTALDEIEKTNFKGTRDTIVALSDAVDISLSNVPQFSGKTLIALDSSGSMQGRPSEIGSLFAAMLYKSNNADLMLFSDNASYVQANPKDSTLTIKKRIPFIAGGTNFNAIFNKTKTKYDCIIILSDMQGWMNNSDLKLSFSEYKKRTGANPRLYSFDLAGHGTLMFPENGVACIAGFSEKVFDLMKVLEEDKNALINAIEAVKI